MGLSKALQFENDSFRPWQLHQSRYQQNMKLKLKVSVTLLLPNKKATSVSTHICSLLSSIGGHISASCHRAWYVSAPSDSSIWVFVVEHGHLGNQIKKDFRQEVSVLLLTNGKSCSRDYWMTQRREVRCQMSQIN